MAQKKIEDLFRKLAKKYNLPANVIEEVFMSQYKKVREEVNALEFPTIKLPSFGKFIPSKTKLSKYKYETQKESLRLKREKNEGKTGVSTSNS